MTTPSDAIAAQIPTVVAYGVASKVLADGSRRTVIRPVYKAAGPTTKERKQVEDYLKKHPDAFKKAAFKRQRRRM